MSSPRSTRASNRVHLATRLALALTVLTALVLAASGGAALLALHSYLLGEVDSQLAQTATVADEFIHEGDERRDAQRSYDPALPEGGFVVSREPRGIVALEGPGEPELDQTQILALADRHRPNQPFEYVLNGQEYRLEVVSHPPDTMVIGLSTATADSTVRRLLAVELISGLAALLVVGFGGYLTLRAGLGPLRRLAAGARSVRPASVGAGALDDPADHHLTLRPEGGSAEVADLSAALVAMLDRIEVSIAAQASSDARLRRFVADASHELRTPLASVRGYAELLRRDALPDDEHRAQAAARIEAETVRLGALLDDLLLLARLDEGQPLVTAPVDLAELITECLADFAVAAPGRDVAVSFDGQPLLVPGDANRLRQVLTNVFANVRLHTPATASVRVRARSDGPVAVIEVADNGPGVAPELQPRVFDRFARAGDGRSRRTDTASSAETTAGGTKDRTEGGAGTGLGLAIVAGIVAAHGGDVRLVSDPSGTSVTVTLPRLREEAGRSSTTDCAPLD